MSSDRYYLTSDDIRQQQRINRAVAELVGLAPVVNRRRNLTASNTSPSSSPHPFDVEIIRSGTEESPSYSVRVFNSALPDSAYAGIVYIGTSTFSVPVDELETELAEGDEFFVDLVITYDAETDPVYTLEFEIRTDADAEDDNNVYRQTIAGGTFPEIASMQSGNITVAGRWV